MTVRVYDPQGELKINKAVGGFIGRLGSQIIYDLGVDRGRRTSSVNLEGSNAWITNIEDLVSAHDAEGMQSRETMRGSCGHRIGGNSMNQSVVVEELFRSSSAGME
jgi:hypothetical protein